MPQSDLEKKVLYPNKMKSMLYVGITLVFVVIGIFMLQDGAPMAWFVTITFGLGLLIFLLNLLPQASYLILDEQGFETSSLFRKHRYSWDDVNDFSVGRISSNQMVMFNFSHNYQAARKARKVSTMIAGAEGALHDTFGMKAQDLAALMQSYKNAYSKAP